jgi:hypothetical protein
MPTSLALIMGFITNISLNARTYEFQVPIAQEIYGKFDANLKMAEHLYAKLLCEQVTPSYFGGSAEQILRFLPVTGLSVGRNTFHEFYQPHFQDINTSTLNKLTFKVTYENSPDILDFDDPSVSTHLTLQIKRYNDDI